MSVVFDDTHSDKIKIDDDYSVQMKYPTMEMAMSTETEDVTVEQSFSLIADCISQIYTEDESWAASDSSEAELIEWVESLQPKQFQKLEHFFLTMPKLSHTIKVMNPNTKVENEIVLEGLGSFFA